MPTIKEIVYNEGEWPTDRHFDSECARECKNFERVYENALYEFHLALQAKYEARFYEVLGDPDVAIVPGQAQSALVKDTIWKFIETEYSYEKGPGTLDEGMLFEDMLRDIFHVKFVEELEEQDEFTITNN